MSIFDWQQFDTQTKSFLCSNTAHPANFANTAGSFDLRSCDFAN